MEINLIDSFESVAINNPDKVVLIHNDDELSLAELRARSQACAAAMLKTAQPEMHTPVAVFMPKRPEVAVANIACAYTENIFMNLDVKTPTSRISNILERVQPALIITDNADHDAISSVAGDIPILNIEQLPNFDFDEVAEEVGRRHSLHIDTDPVCIINTSGSTGTPKGVVLNHRSFFDFLTWACEDFHLTGNEIMGGLSPIVFDIYVFELFMLMTKGSTMVMLDAGKAAFPARLLQEVRDRRINFIFWVPSIMVNIANIGLLDEIDLPDLETVWFAGEVFPTKQFNVWKRHMPGVVFANFYGPIEITLDCTYMIIDREFPDETPLPIGRPFKNTDVLILNEDDQQCGMNEKGELCVRGTSLAMGYYNNPEKTAAAFVQNPLNDSYPEVIYRTGDIVCMDKRGEIQFRGRKDSLVKHMGYRIELGEIEHVIVNTLKLTKYCCVVYDFQNKDIVLYYEASDDFNLSQVRRSMVSVLPKYMIPTKFIRMDELPRNTNGKIDRHYLSTLVG